MNILLTGAAGALGRALDATLRERGHHVLTVGRTSGDLRFDLTDPDRITALYEAAGPLDAVVSAAGSVPCKPLSEMTPADRHSAFPGQGSVATADVAQAYVRSVEGARTGRVYEL